MCEGLNLLRDSDLKGYFSYTHQYFYPMYKILLFLLLCFSSVAYARPITVKDSLLVEIQKSTNDTNKVHLYDTLVCNYLENADDRIIYATEMLQLSAMLNYTEGAARAQKLLGIAYSKKRHHNQSLEYFDGAIELFEKANDKDNVASTMVDIGMEYCYEKKYGRAIDTLTHAAQIALKAGDSSGFMLAIYWTGNAYLGKKKYEEAVDRYFVVQNFNERKANKRGQAVMSIQLAVAFIRQKKFAEAKQFAAQGLALAKEVSYVEGIAIANRCLKRLKKKHYE